MEIRLGRWNNLVVVRYTEYGAYLDGGKVGEILMPKKYVPDTSRVGDTLCVFVYLDGEERLVATTETPRLQVGEFGFLRVAWTNRYGAFLDWGLTKDLFVPFREQKQTMEKDRTYLVFAYIDPETFRIVASAKVERFMLKEPPVYRRGQAVGVLVWQRTDLGYKVIVENRYVGLLYENEVFRSLRTGDSLTVYVELVREDGKIDLTAQRIGIDGLDDFATELLARLQVAGGFLPFTDKSDAADLYEAFGVSKKTFKRSVGILYKRKRILLTPEGVQLAGS